MQAINTDNIIKKIRLRLLPFLALCLIASYLDRVNIGFAALSMNKDLGLSPIIFGFGSGVFFFTYAIFEVPSNYLFERIGARIWFARIMLSWGLVSGLMAFAWNSESFLILRLLLGLAEAGFVPGVVLYLTYWMPHAYRALALSGFMLAIPISSIIGAPISGYIMSACDGLWGLKAWQWLFLIEAIPSIILGFIAYIYLTDRPKGAQWLTHEEINWIESQIDKENSQFAAVQKPSFVMMLLNKEVWNFSLIYFGVVLTLYGLVFWLPQIVHDFGYGPIGIGYLTATPYAIGAIAMVAWSRHVDQNRNHVAHAIVTSLLAGLGLASCAFLNSSFATICALSLSAIGTFSMFPIFWTLATSMIAPARAAGAIAMINSIAALAGFLGPYLVGWVKDATGSFHYALPLLGLGPVMSVALLMTLRAKNLNHQKTV